MRYTGTHRKNPNRILGKENTMDQDAFVREILDLSILDFHGHSITVLDASWIVGWIASRDADLLDEILKDRPAL